MTNQELRETIIRDIKAAYKDIRRIKRLLARPGMRHVYKTRCKTAVTRDKLKEQYEEDLLAAQCELVDAWDALPEIDRTKNKVERLAEAMAFGSRLTITPYRRKYMKNQLKLTA